MRRRPRSRCIRTPQARSQIRNDTVPCAQKIRSEKLRAKVGHDENLLNTTTLALRLFLLAFVRISMPILYPTNTIISRDLQILRSFNSPKSRAYAFFRVPRFIIVHLHHSRARARARARLESILRLSMRTPTHVPCTYTYARVQACSWSYYYAAEASKFSS
jgi:hypothetical protein